MTMKNLMTQLPLAIAITAASAAVSADDLTVVSWGGAYTKSQVEAYHKPFTEKSGTNIVSENYSGGIAEIKAQVEAGNVTWDVIDLEKADVIRACDEGLLVEIDPATLPKGDNGAMATDDFVDGGLEDCGVANIVWGKIVAFDESQFSGKKPSKLVDFFNTKEFPGKRGLKKTPKVNLERALMADGVPGAKVYEVLGTADGVNRAFAKLDQIKDQVVWWEAGSQPVQLLADGEVSMTTAYNGRIYNASEVEGKPFKIIWDAQFAELDFFAIVKGTKNLDKAMEFLKFSTDTKRLADQTNYISYAPARKSSIALVSDKMMPHMATAPENFATAVPVDHSWWADHQDELNERFNAWLNK
ncbi:ABC transporter substrate-binding protein [Aestuariirhabdus sp. Z084]|uniref:ABC transporter substrate-binding protein n=1 Tax=Aestuariirhabdus haliotis TaxID=2918751 RepID=UPI00201B39EB|nr:ABC transporter substrate-binding protein [Aestuariirhabdus haliotis]MCL6415132.1 ABC transporter substrate-binding protein [Aestuariirhabdus haliotis]MCL6419064.1 ABC transporter substrate-binding protein [Aestuariirhabdus haliotis]